MQLAVAEMDGDSLLPQKEMVSMDLISKLKIVLDTIISFFQELDFVKKYFKNYFDNKKNHRSSDKN